jgi:peptidoglycan/LPS O-acetylase OafA/YrhL
MSDPRNPLFAALCLAVALGALALFRRGSALESSAGRYAAIDGLRGYLAFLVFLHHGCIWYYFLRSGKFDVLGSHLYTHFGQSSVLLFFMITGLLFFSKLLEGKQRPIDWLRLYLSRLLRLTPLYLFALLLLGSIVAVESRFVLKDPPLMVLRQALEWLSFTSVGPQNPVVNQLESTAAITSGVVWSLRYEWLFYAALPLLGLTVSVVAPWRYRILSAVAICVLVLGGDAFSKTHLLAFGGGIAAAVMARNSTLVALAQKPWAALLGLGTAAAGVALFPHAYQLPVEALLAVTFFVIAAGNQRFGVLTQPLSRALGDISYGIYLLHGIVLYVAFHYVVGLPRATHLSAVQHWAVVCASGVVVLALASFTFRYIEKPAMLHLPSWTARVRRLGQLRSAKAPALPD